MEHVKTIGIIGAGFSGLGAAKTCLEYGYTVKLFEKEPELGGVWSSSRRYPGVTPQNTKDTYNFSDFPMPGHYDEWPRGEDVQAYLEDYAKKFGVFPLIRFSHEITGADVQNDQWIITGKHNGADFTEQVDFLIICNGTFSDPFIPPLMGIQSFIEAGGTVLHSSQFHNTDLCRNKRLVVVGYSKSAHDVVTAGSETAASTHLLFREAKWKMPRYIRGINVKYIILSRFGEALIKPEQHNLMERVIYKTGLARVMLAGMEKYVSRKQKLKETGLHPTASIKDQAFGEVTLETPHFFERVQQGRIIAKQAEIASLHGRSLTLTNGEQLECDMIVFATGFRQTIPFLPDRLFSNLVDEQGNYHLYRHILPIGVPALAFVGYNTSIQSPISAEFGALWVCEYLKGRIAVPSPALMRQATEAFIKWRSQFRLKGSSSGLSTMPGTIHHVDMLLKDMEAPLPFHSLIPDWLLTINPSRYQQVRRKILKRNIK